MANLGEVGQQIQAGIDQNEIEQQRLGEGYAALASESGPADAAVDAISESAAMQTGIVNDLARAKTRAAEISTAIGNLIGGIGGIQGELLETQRRTDTIHTSSEAATGHLRATVEPANAVQVRMNQGAEAAGRATASYAIAMEGRNDSPLMVATTGHVATYPEYLAAAAMVAEGTTSLAARTASIAESATAQSEGLNTVSSITAELLEMAGPLVAKIVELQAALERRHETGQTFVAIVDEVKDAVASLPPNIVHLEEVLDLLSGQTEEVISEARAVQRRTI